MNTVITKGNLVRQYDPDKGILFISDIADCITVNSNGKVIVNQGNPLTWPDSATDGMQAIVDVKAGTLRFSFDGPMSRDEFVVSEYVEPTPHIFDIINYWPQAQRQCLGTRDLPEGWVWQWIGDDWVLSNGTVGLVRDDWFKYRNKMVEAQQAKQFEPFVSVEDCDPATVKQSVPKGKGNPILGMVLADLTNRALEGKEKYGEPLLANNGRNALWDAYQEALDLAMYLRQAIEEQERP